ncbi:MAG TPA: ferritin-like domain-containing protein [Longimicrobium sp.]|jgi:ferritin-like metal-binding protein YciE|uniref:YciE/YciF ferroxidase family protein n=1 Tax=Longimicrobium sp. TaxID=2029185 RepID=UPI002ED8E9C2
MPATQMHELLKHELGDLLYAEQLILKMLGTLDREVSNPELNKRVQEHAGETEEQIERLRRAFEAIGEKAKAEKCDAAVGLKAEHDSYKKEEKPSKPLLEAFDLGNALRVEHYEIAGYRSAIAVAQVLGHKEVVSLLTESLREEEAMAAFVERNSVKALKLLAEQMEPRDIEFTPETGRPRGPGASKSGGSAAKSSGSKTGERASASKSGGAKSGGAKSGGASKSGGARSSSSRTTAESSSGDGRTGGASKSGGSKSGGAGAKKASSSRGKSSGGSRANA